MNRCIVILLLSIPLVALETPCSTYGFNWAAEIRCLRSLLSQCSSSGPAPHRGARTTDNHHSNSRLSDSRIRSFQQGFSIKPGHGKVYQSNNDIMADLTPNITEIVDKRILILRLQIETDMNRKLNELVTRLESDFRSKLDKESQYSTRHLEQEIRKLKRRVDLLSARIHTFGQHEYIYVSNRESWYHAQDICVQWGGNLASVAFDEENKMIAGLVQDEGAWIGLNDVQKENIFLYPGNFNYTYRNWMPGQPDNGNHNENCIEVSKTGFWSDELCLLRRPFVCKR